MLLHPDVLQDSISVDGSCIYLHDSDTGRIEYKGVDHSTGRDIFYGGPFENGNSSIAEFLAIVHGIEYLIKNNRRIAIYSDSSSAITAIEKCTCTVSKSIKNKKLKAYIASKEKFLKKNKHRNFTILKWNTDEWGEIKSDVGFKMKISVEKRIKEKTLKHLSKSKSKKIYHRHDNKRR